MTQRQGRIIVLNGASSAGKTTIANALLPLLRTNCIYTGLDDILERVQPFGRKNGGVFTQLVRPARIAWFQVTNGRLRLFKRLHREVVSRYHAGHDVIVETALMDARALSDAAACFASLNAFFIGIKPPLAVSEEWESRREDRPPGQARKHYDVLHARGIYDLLLDPSVMTPKECARAILERIENGVAPDAFRQLSG